MSAEVKILVKGSTNADRMDEVGVERDCPTITLVRDGEIIMVVDPGVLASQKILVDALAKENLTVNDINVVCVTHSHIDHYRNVGMFPDAKVLEFFGLWEGDMVVDWQENFTNNIQVLHTPGHDYSSISLLVTTKEGIIAICGDVFWKEDHPHNPHDDPYADDPIKLEDSREMIIKKAEWIIPGHGGMYRSDTETLHIGDAPKKDLGVTIIGKCERCGKEMQKRDRCRCRPHLRIKHCECGLDCQACGCSHKIYQK